MPRSSRDIQNSPPPHQSLWQLDLRLALDGVPPSLGANVELSFNGYEVIRRCLSLRRRLRPCASSVSSGFSSVGISFTSVAGSSMGFFGVRILSNRAATSLVLCHNAVAILVMAFLSGGVASSSFLRRGGSRHCHLFWLWESHRTEEQIGRRMEGSVEEENGS